MRRGGRGQEGGFTYLGVIVLVLIIGLVTAATLKIDALLRRAAAEEELLEIGAEFSAALQSYAAASQRGQPQQPPTLKDLLRDPRFPAVRRHLRKIFVDPMTGKAEWGIMYLGENTGVVGVYSLSDAQPFKVGNFDNRFVNFDNKSKISEWRFTASGQGAVRSGGGDTPMTPPAIPEITPTKPIEPPATPPGTQGEPPVTPGSGRTPPGGTPTPQVPPQAPPSEPPQPPSQPTQPAPQEQPEQPEAPEKTEPAEPPQEPPPGDKPAPTPEPQPGGKTASSTTTDQR